MDLSPLGNWLRVLLALTAMWLGLSGCRPGALLTPSPTSLVTPVETPALTSQPAATVVPTLALPATDPPPNPNPAPDAAPKLPSIDPTLFIHGDRSQPYIALTFDACQAAGQPADYDEAIIRILDATGTPATLFLGGLWAQAHAAQTRALVANPLFELGNHSWSHPDFTAISPEEMSAEILRTQAILYNLTGRQPLLFRFPFDAYTDEGLAAVAQHGLRVIQGDVITGDADPRVSTGDIIDVVTTQAGNGSIIIMHVNGRGWHTAEALPAVIQRLRDQGYTFVTVSQLLGLEPPPAAGVGESQRP